MAVTNDPVDENRIYSDGPNSIDRYAQYAGQDWRVWPDNYSRTMQLAYNDFIQIMGREPTQDEFNQTIPYFSNQGDQGQWTGKAYLNQLRQFEMQDPSRGEGKYAPEELEKFNDSINKDFQDTLGRDATQEEIDHYGKGLASGQLDSYTLRQMIQGGTEYQGQEDEKFRGGLAEELAGYDEPVFNKQKDDILSYYAQQGQPAGTSPSLDFAMTDMMGKIAEQRGKYLAGVSAQQYGGNKQLAIGDYQRQMDQMFGNQDFSRNRQAQQQDYLTGRLGERQDYSQQMGDYMRQMGGQNSSAFNTRDWIGLGLQGANTAAQFYGGGRGGSGGGYGGGGFMPYQSGGRQGPYSYGR